MESNSSLFHYQVQLVSSASQQLRSIKITMSHILTHEIFTSHQLNQAYLAHKLKIKPSNCLKEPKEWRFPREAKICVSTLFQEISLRKFQHCWFFHNNLCQCEENHMKIQRKSERNQWFLSTFRIKKKGIRKL